MVLTKRFLLRVSFVVEIIIFFAIYCFGSKGVQALLTLRKENTQIAFQVSKLQQEVNELEQQVDDWKSSSFYQEKVARETLHMAKKNEEVYFIG